MKNTITLGLTVLGLLLTILGVRFFDITIVGCQLPTSKVKTEQETQIPLDRQSPTSKVKTEQETQTTPQQTGDDKVVKMPFSKLLGILRDLPSSSNKLKFIEDNMNFMPYHLSLDELHRILALFPSNSNKSKVIEVFLSRLPGRLSLAELNHLLDLFSSESDKLKVTKNIPISA